MQDRPTFERRLFGPPRPSTILTPGLPSLPPGVERYTVEGGGAIVVGLEPGDLVTVTDLEGGQPAEVIAGDQALLGERSTVPAEGLKAILSGAGEDAIRLRRALERRQIDLSAARAIRLFAGDGPAGDQAQFRSAGTGHLIVAAPGSRMEPGAQNTTTPLEVHVTRASPKRKSGARFDLPEPLYDPLQDIRVKRATAEGYFVKAGEYIQIIDVDGRQCTDFQCFDARKLDKKLERPLDVTTTRSLIGLGYPAPGLPSKAFDQDLDPLIEVVRDTCGRHDAFGLACTRRYYEDMGYFGHANCTDNFNAALAPYAVTARDGWMALNFFFNTRIDANNVLYLDEPWSRPGDYVLLRAATDLVCVSSACPDDIDAANGWDPSDIHVRTYAANKRITRAVAFRPTPQSDAKLTKETGFHARFAQATRNFVEYRGYWLAAQFDNGGVLEEYWACRKAAVITDLSALRKFEITGPDAEALLQYAVSRDIAKLAAGQVVYTALCYEHGGMLDDATVFRLGPDNFRLVCGDEFCGDHLRQLADGLALKVWMRSSTDQLHNVQVQGPSSRDVLKDIIWTAPTRTPVAALDWFRFTIGRIGHFKGPPVMVSRTGYTGEIGYEVFCHPSDAPAVYDAIAEAGKPFALRPLGLQALDMLRIEAGLVFAKSEFSDATDPFEAGIGFTVPKSKAADFLGKAAVLRRRDNPKERLVGLEIDGKETAVHGDCVHLSGGRAQIGVVTSGCRSPVLEKTIALARLDVTAAEIGTEVEIGKLDGHQKRLPARVVRFPHYDPDKTRVRG